MSYRTTTGTEIIITTERPGHVVYKMRDPKTGEEWAQGSRSNKYLCIGGPFDGQFKAEIQLRKAGLQDHHDGFNFADYWPRTLGRRQKNPHSKIWVYSDLLKLP